MRNFNVTAVAVETEKIVINKNEAAVRLKIPRSYTDETITRCEENLRRVLSFKYAYTKVLVQIKSDNTCDLGFGDIESRDLVKALEGCMEAYILGVTIGIGADRLISRLALNAPGYGDMPLSYQPEILKALNADYTLGITLNNSLLMTPMKSITAIMGIKE